MLVAGSEIEMRHWANQALKPGLRSWRFIFLLKTGTELKNSVCVCGGGGGGGGVESLSVVTKGR